MTQYYCPKHTDELLYDDSPTQILRELRTVPQMVHCPICDKYHYLSDCVVIGGVIGHD